MKFRELLQQITDVQNKIGCSKPYICGGLPRDRYMGKIENIVDVDITTGDKSIENLSKEFAVEFQKQYNVTRKIMNDHSSIMIGKLKLDFSSNFIVPNIDKILKTSNNLQKEIFSRDFTCNSLLLNFNLKDLYDLTKRGLSDIKGKTIRTCLEPKITLLSNKNRVVRSIYLAAKLDFSIDNSIIEFVKNNPESIKIASDKTLKEKLNKAVQFDADKTVYYINKMNLWNHIPITDKLQPYYLKSI